MFVPLKGKTMNKAVKMIQCFIVLLKEECSWLFPVSLVGGTMVRVDDQCLRGHSKVTVRSDRRQIFLNKFLYFRHLLGTGAVREVAEGFKLDHFRVHYSFDQP